MAYKDNLTVTEQLKNIAATQSINNIETGRITAYSNSKGIYTIQLLSGVYVQAVPADTEADIYQVNATVEVIKTRNIKGTVSILRYAPLATSTNMKTYHV